MTELIDRFGRTHRDLRVSLTDRCNLRCAYCLPAEGVAWLAREELLSRSELVKLVHVATALGVRRVRLTGGEPLLRPDLVEIVQQLAALPRAPELSLTTNGIGLARVAPALRAAGLRRVNVSLDSLDAATFARLTRRDRHAEVLAGIAAATSAGLHPVKVNTVLMRGHNDHEAAELARWALRQGLQLRFIEQMPLEPHGLWDRSVMVTREEILADLGRAGFTLQPLPGRGAAPAERFQISGHGLHGEIGIVASITAPFCAACDRVRLTADGAWRTCLFATGETDLRGPLRAGASEQELADMMRGATLGKPLAHGTDAPGTIAAASRPMSAIGG